MISNENFAPSLRQRQAKDWGTRLDVRELLFLQQREKCFLLTSPFIEPGKGRGKTPTQAKETWSGSQWPGANDTTDGIEEGVAKYSNT